MKRILLLLIFCLFIMSCTKKQDDNTMIKKFENIRQPAVAGQFYPGEAGQLKRKIEKYLEMASSSPIVGGQIKAIMVPHAGYDFSAAVAAYSYKQLGGKAIGTAVIICNSHTAYFPGIAIDENDTWQTPLGIVKVDKSLADKLVKAEAIIKYNKEAHETEHSLEVQLPFLQTVLKGEFKILPILFGNQDKESYTKLADILSKNLGDDDVVIISTDMSHYPSYEDANKIDNETLEEIKTKDAAKLEEYIEQIESQNVAGEQTLICGIDGVKTVMKLAKNLGWDKIEVLKYANSGDVEIGDKNRVVGYGAVAFNQTQNLEENKENMLDKQQQEKLLEIAKETVESFVVNGKVPEYEITDERLNWREGAFVTLKKNGELRGCIGQIVPSDKPLWQVVRDMAIAACSEDTRFNPVEKSELDNLDYEVSVLSAPEPINDWHKIELGKHGVIIKQDFHSGVFLPQVAEETGWSKEEFLSQLCWQKAGLSPDCYKNKDVQILVFTAQVF